MKKALLFIVLSLVYFISFGQSTMRMAPDFTAVTLEQDTFNLNQLLEENKYIALEFFFNEGILCKETSPLVSQAFQQLGCNDYEVVFLSINAGNDSLECAQYRDELNLATPIVSGLQGMGDSIAGLFDVQSFPTVILISPEILSSYDLIVNDTITENDSTYYTYDTIPYNYNIAIDDIWPIYSLDDIVDTLVTFDIMQHQCAAGISDFLREEYKINLYPNPATDVLKLQSSQFFGKLEYKILDLSGRTILHRNVNIPIGSEVEVDVSWLKSGMYIFQLSDDEKSASTKVLIEN